MSLPPSPYPVFTFWEVLGNHTVSFLVASVGGVIAFFGRSWNSRLEQVEVRLHKTEKDIAVIESQINDLGKDIEEIKTGINRLIDKLI